MDLADKIVLVTGSSRGIGEAIAYAFAKEKSKIIITFREDPKDGEKVSDKCKELGASEAFLLKLDILNNESIKAAKESVEEKFGHVDILINNAGVISWEKFEGETFTDIENQVRTNLEGLIKMTSAFLPQIKEGIINIASRAGHIPYAGRSVYSATKFGVVGFTKSLALEYPDLKIFTISPGATKTDMWDFESGTDPSKVADLIVKAWKGEVPLKDGDLNVWEII